MAADVQWSGPGVTFRVDGLDRTLRALSAAGADAADLKSLMQQVGTMVEDATRTEVPVKTGTLKGSLQVQSTPTTAKIRAGGTRVPYAGVQEYGWPRRNIPGRHFLQDGLARERQQVFVRVADGISELLRQHRLG